jgi:hypothetical protein
MLDCVQCSSIVFNLHYVQILYFHSHYHYVHMYIFSQHYLVFLVAQADGGKGVRRGEGRRRS